MARVSEGVGWAAIGRELGRTGNRVRGRHGALTTSKAGSFSASEVSKVVNACWSVWIELWLLHFHLCLCIIFMLHTLCAVLFSFGW